MFQKYLYTFHRWDYAFCCQWKRAQKKKRVKFDYFFFVFSNRNRHFCCWPNVFFCPKWAKMTIFDVFHSFLEPNMASITKNDKTTIISDKCLDVLGNSREKNFFPLLCLSTPYGVICFVCKIYIFAYVTKMIPFQDEVAELQIFFQISKSFAFEL